MSRSIPVLILIAVGVCAVGVIAIVAYRSSGSSELALGRISARIDRLDDRLEQLDEILSEMQREARSSSASPGEASEVDATLREITAGAQYFEELAFHVELLLEALAAAAGNMNVAGSATTYDPPDATTLADHLAHLEMLSERSREIRAERLRQFEATNRQLRHRWIRSMGRDLGFSADQEDGVVELYDRQSARWSELYERISRDGLVHSEVADEMRTIREHTDRELERILGAELKERFRAGEGVRFPSDPEQGDRR